MHWNAKVVFAAIISFGIVLATSPVLFASTIESIDVQLGSWNGGSFSGDGSEWDTFNGGDWAVVATAPGFGNPTLDGLNNVNLPGDQYWLFMADDQDPATAIQITLGYASGSVVEVYTDPQGPQFGGTYTLVSGTGFSASLISGPQNNFEPAPTSQATSGGLYVSSGTPDWVIQLDQSPVPEPASGSEMTLGALVLAALVFGRRRLQLQRG